MAYSENKKPSGLDAAASVAGTDVFVLEKSGSVQRATATQIVDHAFSTKGVTAAGSGSEVAVVRDGATLKDIALSNIVPAGNITNEKVADNAAIAGTKINPNFGSQNVSTTGSTSTGSLAASGNATVGGTLVVTGTLTANGGINATITGNSSTASQLANTRNIAATSDVAWNVNFNGSTDVTAAATIQPNVVSDAKLRTSGACSVVGRSANTTGNVADITAASDNTVLRRASGALGFSQVTTDLLENSTSTTTGVTNAKLRQSAGLSVIGRSANTAGAPADIAGTDGQVFRVSGTTLGFGQVTASGLSTDAVETAKIKDGNVTNAKFAGSVGLNAWTTKAGSYTAVAGDRINANTTSSAFTITLPATPTDYTEVTLADHAGTWKTNNLTVARNGSNINGLAENLVCDVSEKQILLRYEGATIGWRIYA